jgi:AAA+ superfamily predicted ATPase
MISLKGKVAVALRCYSWFPSCYSDPSSNTQYSGPPGVGKTLTAESMSEVLQLPLYTVCALSPLGITMLIIFRFLLVN